MSNDIRPLTGIHGWLALLWFGLVVGGPISILAEIGNNHPSGALDVFLLAYLAFSIFCGLKLRSTMKPAKIFLIVRASLGILIVLIGILMGATGDSKSAAEEIMGGFEELFPALIWLAYLHSSVRVKNTYPADFERQPVAPAADANVVAK